ncbi:MAG: hypothetical protein O3A00_13365 [Planctomycetota bacterium]|nr:hypothetical protein [Planctomycetota bacterium]
MAQREALVSQLQDLDDEFRKLNRLHEAAKGLRDVIGELQKQRSRMVPKDQVSPDWRQQLDRIRHDLPWLDARELNSARPSTMRSHEGSHEWQPKRRLAAKGRLAGRLEPASASIPVVRSVCAVGGFS